MFPQYYLDQLEKQLDDLDLSPIQRDKIFDTVVAFGDARYRDGCDDGKAAFRSER